MTCPSVCLRLPELTIFLTLDTEYGQYFRGKKGPARKCEITQEAYNTAKLSQLRPNMAAPMREDKAREKAVTSKFSCQSQTSRPQVLGMSSMSSRPIFITGGGFFLV